MLQTYRKQLKENLIKNFWIITTLKDPWKSTEGQQSRRRSTSLAWLSSVFSFILVIVPESILQAQVDRVRKCFVTCYLLQKYSEAKVKQMNMVESSAVKSHLFDQEGGKEKSTTLQLRFLFSDYSRSTQSLKQKCLYIFKEEVDEVTIALDG